MEIFLDTSNLSEISNWLDQGIIDGVTTNPSIMRKDGHRDLERGAKEIAELIYPRPVSVEVWTNDFQEMLVQAREFSRWAENVVVKITIINEQGSSSLAVIHKLASEGIKINCTACLSMGQAMLASKAGATYASLFLGRINDEGGDGPTVIRNPRSWLDMWDMETKIIVGSIRSPIDIQQAALAGAHVVTAPPQLLSKFIDHKYSRFTVQEFVSDGQHAFGQKPAESVQR